MFTSTPVETVNSINISQQAEQHILSVQNTFPVLLRKINNLAQRGYLKFTFGAIVRSFFVVRVKKGILRAVTLSINKAFMKPILTFWPFLTIIPTYTCRVPVAKNGRS